jgi:hypothetical protein
MPGDITSQPPNSSLMIGLCARPGNPNPGGDVAEAEALLIHDVDAVEELDHGTRVRLMIKLAGTKINDVDAMLFPQFRVITQRDLHMSPRGHRVLRPLSV